MACVRARNRAITGTTRRNSSSNSTGWAPGRVDSPPTSMMAAPSSAICTPLRDRIIEPYELPAVRKRVRRDIQHAHDDRALEPEHPSPTMKYRM